MNFLGGAKNKDSGDRKAQQSYSEHKHEEGSSNWVSDFGFKDRKTSNVHVRIYLEEKVYFVVDVDGGREIYRQDWRLDKKLLARKPVRHITICGRHLSISFNLKTDQLTLKHNGEDVERLPHVEKVLQICRNKTKHSQTSDQRMTQFHAIYDNVRHVISVTYFKKRKYLEVRLNKTKEGVKGKKLTQQGVFPVKLQDGETQWKIAVFYDIATDSFGLSINDIPFPLLPYQAEVVPHGPQNIERGKIKLNKVKVHKGYVQYAADTIEEWVAEQEEPTEDIKIQDLECSSSAVVNAVFDDLGQTVGFEQGLKHLTIMDFDDKNELQEWPLGQLALKCHALQTLKLENFAHYITDTTRSRLLEFAGRAITSSRCLNTLHIGSTSSSVSDGAQFFQTLADSECNKLTSITINYEEQWFEDTEECMGPLLAFLTKQTGLETLSMPDNKLSNEQKMQIRQTVSASAPGCKMGGKPAKEIIEETQGLDKTLSPQSRLQARRRSR